MIKRSLFTVGLVALLTVMVAFPAWAVPQVINYQGKLTDSGGSPLDGVYQMIFSLYELYTGGSDIWDEQQSVTVTDGIYSVQLGSGSGFPAGLFDDYPSLYLQVAIFTTGEGWEILSPRQHLTSTAFSMRAAKAEDAETLDGKDSTEFSESGHDHSFEVITGTATDTQIPDSITINNAATADYAATADSADYADTAGNADTVDGQHASAFAESIHQHSGADIASGTVAEALIAASIARDSEIMTTVLSSDGSGSGLDADRLDGLQASAFMAASVDNWVDEAGDTMTGPLSVPSLEIDGTTAFVADESNNTFIGFSAGSNTTGDYNTFIGRSAGYSNTTGYSNVFMGTSAGFDNTGGYDNTFIGTIAGTSNTAGHDNTFIGNAAGYVNETGDNNTFIGSRAGYNNTSNYNTFIGFEAGYLNTGGYANAFLGDAAGRSNTTGRGNTFIGNAAGRSNITGKDNTFLGRNAGYFNTEGEGNVFIGYEAGKNNTVAHNQLYIANSATNTPLIFGDFATGYLHVNGDVSVESEVVVGGDLRVDGEVQNISWSEQESYYSIPAAAFESRYNDRIYENFGSSLSNKELTQDIYLVAPVQLPHNARIDKITVYWQKKQEPNNASIRLYRVAYYDGVQDQMVYLATVGNELEQREYDFKEGDDIAHKTINNLSYYYYMHLKLPPMDVLFNPLEFYSARIAYVTTGPH